MATEKPTRAGSRGWLWFFIALVLLSGAAIGVQFWYNPTVPLTPALLADAEAKWKQHGPHDYDLDYTIKKIESTERFQVKVRNGKAISLIMNGNLALEARLYPSYTMPGLYGVIDEFMQQDTQPGSPRTFTNVFFDPVDGHLIHYVRSVASKRQRVEIIVHLTPLPAASPDGT